MSEKFDVDIIRRDFLGFVKTHYVSAEIFIKILEEANNKGISMIFTNQRRFTH